MDVVILAAGKGTRLIPYTNVTNKVLIPVLDRPFIFYILDELSKLSDIRRIFLVVNHKKEKIEEILGNKYKNLRIDYVYQKNPLGTGDAVKSVENKVDEEFLVICGDVYTDYSSLIELSKEELAVLGYIVDNPKYYGVLDVKEGYLVSIEEKPEKPKSNIINTCVLKLNRDIFSYLEKIEKSPRGEYELTDAIKLLSKDRKVRVVMANEWIELGKLWDIIEVNKYFLKKEINKLNNDENYREELGYKKVGDVFIKEGTTIEEYVKINGRGIVSGEIKEFTSIEGLFYIGNKSKVGPFARLREFVVLMENSKIGFSCEVKNSVIFKNSKIPHLSYVGDSVIGENVNFGANTIIANLRFDEKSVKVKIEDKVYDSGRRKLGAFVGNNVKTGISVKIMPGSVIGNNTIIFPGKIVKGYIEDNSIIK